MATTPLEASIQALLDVLRLLPQGIASALGGRPPTGGTAPGASAFAGQSQTVAAGFAQGGAAIGMGLLTGLFPPLQRLTREFGGLADVLRHLRESAGQGSILAGTGAATAAAGVLTPAQRASLAATAVNPLVTPQQRDQAADRIRISDAAQRTALGQVAASPLLSPRERSRLQGLIRTANVTQQRHQRAVTAYQGAQQTARRVQAQFQQQYQRAVTLQGVAVQTHHRARRQHQRATALVGRRQRQLATNQQMLAIYQAAYTAHPSPARAADVAYAQRQVRRSQQQLGTARSRRRVADRAFQQAAQGLTAARARVGAVFRAGHAAVGRAFGAVAGTRGAARTTGAAATTAQAALATGGHAAALVAGRAAVGAIGNTVTAFISLNRAIYESVRSITDYAERINQGNRALAGFSGRMAGAFAQLDVHQFRRDFERARGTEETSVQLTKSVDRMRDNQQLLNISLGNIQNRFASEGASFGGGFQKSLGEVTSLLDRMAEGIGIGSEKSSPWIEKIGEGVGLLVTMTGLLSVIQKLLGEKPDPFAKPQILPMDQLAVEIVKGNAAGLMEKGQPARPLRPRLPMGGPIPRANPFGRQAGGFGAGGPNAGP